MATSHWCGNNCFLLSWPSYDAQPIRVALKGMAAFIARPRRVARHPAGRGLYEVLDPYLVVANAMPKTAFVPIFYIWLGPTQSIYAMSLAISLFVGVCKKNSLHFCPVR
jgi:hypothetical protein